MDMPPHARAGQRHGRGHRFAAYPRCSADQFRGAAREASLRQTRVFLIAAVAVALTAGTCDRYYGLRRTVSLQSTPDNACVERALQAANVGTVTHRCDTSSDTGRLTDFFRIEGATPDEWVALSIPRAPGAPSEASFSWGRLNRRPTREQTARIRRIMNDAYAAARNHCPGLPDPTNVKESCGWCE